MTYITELSDPEEPIQYTGTVLASGSTQLQDWVIMRTEKDGDCLFINNQLQSSTLDEALYHEMIVHALLSGTRSPKDVLILGGAEGCMLREVLRWDSVKNVLQVDWDEGLCKWFQEEGAVWNGGAYKDPRVTVMFEDALTVLRFTSAAQYDAIFIDLLDPHTPEDLKFMKDAIEAAKRALKPGGGICVNVGLVKKGQKTPACELANYMKATFKEPGFHRCAFKVDIPSYFGEWGFLMATGKNWAGNTIDLKLPPGLKHFNRTEFIQKTQWNNEYPEELVKYWQTQKSWANIAAKPLLPIRENEIISINKLPTKELHEYYGC